MRFVSAKALDHHQIGSLTREEEPLRRDDARRWSDDAQRRPAWKRVEHHWRWRAHGRGAWNLLFGGFEIAWIQAFESGNPLTFSYANSPYNYYPAFIGARRPNLVGTPEIRDNWRDFGKDHGRDPRFPLYG